MNPLNKFKALGVTTVLLVCTLAAGAAQAEGKIGYVNSQRILNEAPQAAKAKKKIEKEFEKRDQDLQKLTKQLQTLQESIEKGASSLSEADRRGKEREFSDLNRDLQRKQREFKEDLSLRQNEEMMAIFERVNRAIKNVAEAEKFDVILQEVVYAHPRIDITDKVIKVLNEGGK